ncbi:hypothetical protein PF005_g24081 [Phytophthora fragariae]|uniref:Cation/H+ exchanger domain-containing protein n=1 Tax=Phytophthora fragariae TaxID=53985 RepID=A0A6A3W9T6_9STRA|nr:hypothetical protein PF005_g24081 [Phytophthora fragariae]
MGCRCFRTWLPLAASAAAALAPSNASSSFDSLLQSTRLLADADHTVLFNSWSNVPDTLSHLLAFVLVLLGARPLGLFFPKYVRLPLITVYLVAGILSGPFLANLLNEDVVDMLGSYVIVFALSFISFQAGQEIYLPELRPQIKSILAQLATYYCTAMTLGTNVFMLAAGAFFYSDLAHSSQLGIALMFASISVLVSPSTVMPLKIELNSVGPFTHLALGTSRRSPESIAFTMGVVLMNLVLGALLGLVMILIFQLPSGQPDEGYAASGAPVHAVSVTYSRVSASQRRTKNSSQRTYSKQDGQDLWKTTRRLRLRKARERTSLWLEKSATFCGPSCMDCCVVTDRRPRTPVIASLFVELSGLELSAAAVKPAEPKMPVSSKKAKDEIAARKCSRLSQSPLPERQE